jgi:hypothetical protein
MPAQERQLRLDGLLVPVHERFVVPAGHPEDLCTWRLLTAMNEHPAFADIGKRMLQAWQDGVDGLRDKRVYALGEISLGDAFSGFSDRPKLVTKKSVVGRSELLGSKK